MELEKKSFLTKQPASGKLVLWRGKPVFRDGGWVGVRGESVVMAAQDACATGDWLFECWTAGLDIPTDKAIEVEHQPMKVVN